MDIDRFHVDGAGAPAVADRGDWRSISRRLVGNAADATGGMIYVDSMSEALALGAEDVAGFRLGGGTPPYWEVPVFGYASVCTTARKPYDVVSVHGQKARIMPLQRAGTHSSPVIITEPVVYPVSRFHSTGTLVLHGRDNGKLLVKFIDAEKEEVLPVDGPLYQLFGTGLSTSNNAVDEHSPLTPVEWADKLSALTGVHVTPKNKIGFMAYAVRHMVEGFLYGAYDKKLEKPVLIDDLIREGFLTGPIVAHSDRAFKYSPVVREMVPKLIMNKSQLDESRIVRFLVRFPGLTMEHVLRAAERVVCYSGLMVLGVLRQYRNPLDNKVLADRIKSI